MLAAGGITGRSAAGFVVDRLGAVDRLQQLHRDPVQLRLLAILLGQSAFCRRGRAELVGTPRVTDRVADAFSDRLVMFLRGRPVDVAGQLGAPLMGTRGIVPGVGEAAAAAATSSSVTGAPRGGIRQSRTRTSTQR